MKTHHPACDAYQLAGGSRCVCKELERDAVWVDGWHEGRKAEREIRAARQTPEPRSHVAGPLGCICGPLGGNPHKFHCPQSEASKRMVERGHVVEPVAFAKMVDGSKANDLGEFLTMAQMAADSGFNTVIAEPKHILLMAKERDEALARVRELESRNRHIESNAQDMKERYALNRADFESQLTEANAKAERLERELNHLKRLDVQMTKERDDAMDEIAELKAKLGSAAKLSELETACPHGKARCWECEEAAPVELLRLNPYARHDIDNKPPTDPLGSFVWGVRYYLGMLDDDDNWSHSLGHIESLCRDFRAAIAERSVKASELEVMP